MGSVLENRMSRGRRVRRMTEKKNRSFFLWRYFLGVFVICFVYTLLIKEFFFSVSSSFV